MGVLERFELNRKFTVIKEYIDLEFTNEEAQLIKGIASPAFFLKGDRHQISKKERLQSVGGAFLIHRKVHWFLLSLILSCNGSISVFVPYVVDIRSYTTIRSELTRLILNILISHTWATPPILHVCAEKSN